MTRGLIFHSVSNTQWGGQERRVFNECKWMAAQGYAIAIATPGHTPLFEKAADQGWAVHDLGFTNGSAIKDFFTLRRLLREYRPMVFNTHGNMDAKVGMAAARGADIPCVILSRHITPAVNNTWINRRLYHAPHYVFTTADCTTDQIVRDLGVPRERAFTVSSGIIPPETLLNPETARTVLAESLGQPPDTRFIGYMGRLDEAKGLFDIVRAFGAIAKAYPLHQLVLVGGSDDISRLTALIRELELGDRVLLPGYTDQPWDFYPAFDCKVLASQENEGIAQSILEAMYAGCPVIGTAVGGIPDVITHKETGLLVPPRSPEAIAQALKETLDQAEATRNRVEKARAYIEASHTLEAMGQKILALMSQCLPPE